MQNNILLNKQKWCILNFFFKILCIDNNVSCIQQLFNFVISFSLFAVREGYKVRSEVNITFEFRTNVMNGVLLGISAKIDAIGLEIVSGKVGFEMDLLQYIYPNKS